MDDLRIEKLTVKTIQLEGFELLRANCAEVEARELNVRWSDYYRAEEAGQLLAFGARVNEELIGYVIGFYLQGHPHHADWHYVMVDVLYVDPEHRATRALVRLQEAMRRAARAVRASSILWQAKRGSPFQHVLAEGDRYKLIEQTYEEDL